MSWKHWTAVIVVIGFGIVWQIPRHDDTMTEAAEGHAHPAAGDVAAPDGATATPSQADTAGPYRTIALEVTGMT